MARRSNPQSRRPSPGASRATGRKPEENKDSELRQARAVKKAQEQEKVRLRRGDWNTEPEVEAEEVAEVAADERPWNADFGEEEGDEHPEDEESEA